MLEWGGRGRGSERGAARRGGFCTKGEMSVGRRGSLAWRCGCE